MYIPKQFAETRLDVLHDLIRAHPFATLAVADDEGLTLDHIPFVLDADAGRDAGHSQGKNGTLRGHVARANPVWRRIGSGHRVTVAFHGPHLYVSPSWYASKQAHGKVVPTWNYAMVHAHGTARTVEDAERLRPLLDALTNTQEAAFAQPWQVGDAPADFTAKQMTAIVGIELPIDVLEGKWKISQNRSAEDRASVLDALAVQEGEPAAAMLGMMK